MAAKAKAAERYSEVVRDELSCPICFEDFEEPKSLPMCAHNVCKQCLKNMVKSKRRNHIECPICRKKSPIPDNGIDGFPTNTLLKRLVDHKPGRREIHEIREALEQGGMKLKEMRDKIQSIQNDKESAISISIGQFLELEKEVAKTADKVVKEVREEERQLNSQIKRYLEERCETYDIVFGQEERGKLDDLCEQTKQHFKQVEYTLKNLEPEEAIESKDKVIGELHQRTTTLEESIHNPDFSIPFDFRFKERTNRKCMLGKVLKNGDTQTEITDNLENAVQSKSTSTSGILGNALRNGSTYRSDEIMSLGDEEDIPRIYLPSSGANGTSRNVESAETLIKLVNLRFMPTSLAVSPNMEKAAILCAEKKEVHIFSPSYKHLKTIHVQSGILTDVAFSTNEEIIVVNRASSRLLFFTKEGKFLRKYLKGHIANLKVTSIFVDETSRLILTSTPSEGTMDPGVGHPCIAVFNADREFCFSFGKDHLKNPYGKAIYHSNTFFVPDNGSSIKSFDKSGVFLFKWAVENPNPKLHLAVNPENNTALVVDQSQKSVSIYDHTGNMVSTIQTVSGVPKFVAVINGKNNAQGKVIVMNEESKILEIHALLS